jgi:hypothetical protein
MITMTHPPDVAVRVFGGVDTHKDVHVAAALEELGRLLGTGSFSTTMDGHRQLWRWMRSLGRQQHHRLDGFAAHVDAVAGGVGVRAPGGRRAATGNTSVPG